MVIEQAQILTTHNLAALVHPIGVNPPVGWPELARRAFAATCRHIVRLQHNPTPLRGIKDAAYAWRQMLFFMAMCRRDDQIALSAWVQDGAGRHREHAIRRLAPALAGLRHVLAGGSLDDGSAPDARRFLGWSVGGHWMRDEPVRQT
jgi:hypothetical protein